MFFNNARARYLVIRCIWLFCYIPVYRLKFIRCSSYCKDSKYCLWLLYISMQGLCTNVVYHTDGCFLLTCQLCCVGRNRKSLGFLFTLFNQLHQNVNCRPNETNRRLVAQQCFQLLRMWFRLRRLHSRAHWHTESRLPETADGDRKLHV